MLASSKGGRNLLLTLNSTHIFDLSSRNCTLVDSWLPPFQTRRPLQSAASPSSSNVTSSVGKRIIQNNNECKARSGRCRGQKVAMPAIFEIVVVFLQTLVHGYLGALMC